MSKQNELKQAARIFAKIGEMAYQHAPAARIEREITEEFEERVVAGEDVSKEEIADERIQDSVELALDLYREILILFEILDINEE